MIAMWRVAVRLQHAACYFKLAPRRALVEGSFATSLLRPSRQHYVSMARTGEFLNLVRNSGKLPANFSANVDGEFFLRIFRPCFSRVSAPPPPKKKKQFTPKLHAQKSSACLSNFTFSSPNVFHGDFLLTGETNMCATVEGV